MTVKFPKPIETISRDQITVFNPASPQRQLNGLNKSNSAEEIFLEQENDIFESEDLKVPIEHNNHFELYKKCFKICGKKLSNDELIVFRHFYEMRFDLFSRFDEGIQLDYG